MKFSSQSQSPYSSEEISPLISITFPLSSLPLVRRVRQSEFQQRRAETNNHTIHCCSTRDSHFPPNQGGFDLSKSGTASIPEITMFGQPPPAIPLFPHPPSFLAFQSGLHTGKIKSSSSRCVGSLFIAMVFFILNVDPSNLISAVFILDSHDKLQKHRFDNCRILYSSWKSNFTHTLLL